MNLNRRQTLQTEDLEGQYSSLQPVLQGQMLKLDPPNNHKMWDSSAGSGDP